MCLINMHKRLTDNAELVSPLIYFRDEPYIKQALFDVSMVTYQRGKPIIKQALFDVFMVTYLRGEPYVK